MSGPRARRLFLLCLLSAAPLSACSRIAYLTPSEQNSFGTWTFAAPLAVTAEAARGALQGLGHTIAFVDPGGRRITTVRTLVGAQASIGLDGRSADAVYMQFDLRLQPVDRAHTRVTAVPHQYAGARDISDQRTWRLDGDDGLHSQWRTLFRSIESRLPR